LKLDAEINTTDNIVVLMALYSFLLLVTQQDNKCKKKFILHFLPTSWALEVVMCWDSFIVSS